MLVVSPGCDQHCAAEVLSGTLIQVEPSIPSIAESVVVLHHLEGIL